MLFQGLYVHEPYESFYVSDPKLRHIHKASVRDRVIHQAMFRVLYSIFDTQFVHDSYSCRIGKGVHRGVSRLEEFARKVSKNCSRPAYVLQCDIRRFFDSIDHSTLLKLLRKKIYDKRVLAIVENIIASFERSPGKGLPLGNVTSQLFANVYMNEFDQWVKHVLKAHYYIRYCDDFLILDPDIRYLRSLVPRMQEALHDMLALSLHPDKIGIRTVRQGIDFIGYVVLPHARTIRTRTKRRALRRVAHHNLASYLGIAAHADARKFRQDLIDAAAARGILIHHDSRHAHHWLGCIRRTSAILGISK